MHPSTRFPRGTAAALFAAALTALLWAIPPLAAANHPRVFHPGSHPYGMPYGEWAAAWWQWAYSLPVDDNPLFDETGEKAGNGQSGRVFFLAGVINDSGTVTRTITVSQGQALFFPILNFENDNYCPPNDPPLGEEELRAGAAAMMDDATDLALEIDGVSLRHPEQFRTQSPVFSVTFPDNNVFQHFDCDVPAGTYDLFVDDGYYVMVKPLASGEHTIHFHGSVPSADFTLDITYYITVK